MLGRSAFAKSSKTDSRTFIYEVTGLNQTSQIYQTQAAIRSSGKTLISVPFNRMGNFMQQMNSLGGKIVSIRPSDAPAQTIDTSAQTSDE